MPFFKRSQKLKPSTNKNEAKDTSTNNDIIIIVFGPAGAGKSTFINIATRGNEAPISHDLSKRVDKIQPIKCTYPGDKQGRHVIFVEAPSFERGYGVEVAQQISGWMHKTYGQSNFIAGILYLHPISSLRMPEIPLSDLRIFQQLCGSYLALRKVLLIITFWGSERQLEATVRDDQLLNEYWKPMNDKGSSVVYFEDSAESAWLIVSCLVEDSDTKRKRKQTVPISLVSVEDTQWAPAPAVEHNVISSSSKTRKQNIMNPHVIGTEARRNEKNLNVELAGDIESDKDPSQIVSKLESLFENLDQYKAFLNHPRSPSQSQDLLDLFQRLLEDSSLEPRFQRNLIVATQRLSKATDLYPTCYDLEGVELNSDDPVASGGFADIYTGYIEGIGVCLKVVRLYQKSQVEYVMKSLYREAIIWRQLSHPNLLPFYGLYRFGNRACMVSPWIDGGEISMYLERNPNATRILLALDTAKGMSYLHANGIVHGDLKGPNILVDIYGRAQLADFGLSAVTDPTILKWTTHSTAASKGGSTRWQAPELFDTEDEDNDGSVRNSQASDIYAWACVCYEIFTGSLPYFECPNEFTVVLRVRLGKRPQRPNPTNVSWKEWGLTEDIWTLKEDCWKTDPSKRPSADGIVNRLSSISPSDFRRTGTEGKTSPVLSRACQRPYPSAALLDTMV